MCFKKLWNMLFPKPDPVPDPEPVVNKKTALLFAINNYPGSANDLNGCLNDQRDIARMLDEKFPGFDIRKVIDSDVTRGRFISDVTNAINNLHIGDFLLVHYSGHGTQVYDSHGDESDGYDEAIYTYNGPVIDDDIGFALKNIPDGATVLLMFDSCFSGTVTRNMDADLHPTRNRYIQTLPKREKKRRRFKKEEMKWIVLSGCGESQTSADAYIGGEYHGAFTYYAIKALQTWMTYQDWINEIHDYLPSKQYDQNPTLEGRESLFSKQVFT